MPFVLNSKSTGHESVVHGGIISYLFDDSLGMITDGNYILTKYVNVQFKAPIRPYAVYYLVGQTDKVEDQKIFNSGAILDETGAVFATAEALCIAWKKIEEEFMTGYFGRPKL